jgi:hypothetical protein
MTARTRMSRLRTTAKYALSLAIVISATYFFARAFSKNWSSVRAHDFRFDPLFVSFTVVATVGVMLLATYGWYLSINSFSARSKVTFRQSIAAVNVSGLTKYIPGKVWSFGLQLYWLDGLGIAKSVILYVNLINLLVSILTAVILGLGCLLFSASGIPVGVRFSTLAALIVLDVGFVAFHGPILNAVISTFNRVFHRSVPLLDVRNLMMLELHAVHFVANALQGCSMYLLCRAIGYRLDLSGILLVVSASLISDVVGFLAFLVPGGLGVREGAMYWMLGTSTGSLALVLPLVSRMVSMLADIGLGAVALRLLRSFAVPKSAFGER